MNELLLKINQANPLEINEIVQAVQHRYQELFPEWEIIFLSFTKYAEEEKNKQINEIIDFLKSLL